MTDPQNNPESTAQQQPEPTPAPPWGSDDQFDPAKAWSLIQALRTDKQALAERSFGSADEFTQAKQAMQQVKALEDASRSDLEKQVEETTRWQSEAQKWRGAAVSAQITQLAAEQFADPDDALGAIGDAAQFIDAAGTVNTAAIKQALDDVLARKPHWARQADSNQTTAPAAPRAPAPNPLQGTSGKQPALTKQEEFGAFLTAQLRR